MLVLTAVIALAFSLERLLGLSGLFVPKVLLLSCAGAALLVLLAKRHLPARSFGAANAVTLARAGMTVTLLGLLGEQANSSTAWFAALSALMIVTLDGVDGRLARRRGECTPFGARFDMETDALLILGVAALAWHQGKAGPWILAAGLMRYAFVGSAYLLPWMKRPLPASQRRRVIFVTQAASLIVCLSPVLAPPASEAVALAGLAFLTASFAVDVAWLIRAHWTESGPEGDHLTMDHRRH